MLETVFKVCHIRVVAYWAVLNRSTLAWGQIAAKISFVANQKSSIFHVWTPRNQLVLSDRVISAQIHFHCDQDGKMNLCPPLKHFVAIFTHFYIYLMLSQRKRQWFMNDFMKVHAFFSCGRCRKIQVGYPLDVVVRPICNVKQAAPHYNMYVIF